MKVERSVFEKPKPPARVEPPVKKKVRLKERLVPLLNGAPFINLGQVYNVRRFGAIGYDGIAAHTAADTLAFQRAAAACDDRASVIDIAPTGGPNQAGTGYNINASYLDSLGCGRGCITLLRELVNTDVQQIVPREHRIVGLGEAARDTYRGSTIRATGSFPNDGTAIVRLGREADTSASGIRLEHLLIDGNGTLNQVVGVYSNCVQEKCGLLNVKIQAVNSGAIFDRNGTPGTGYPNNFRIQGVEIYPNAAFTGYGLFVHNGQGPTLIEGVTVAAPHATSIGNIGFCLRGAHITLVSSHAEYVAYGLEIGGDGGSQTYNMLVDGFSGYNPAANTDMTALIVIRDDETYNWSVELNRISVNEINGTDALVIDERNDVQLALSTATNQHVGYYRYWGNNASASTVALTPETSGTTSAYP